MSQVCVPKVMAKRQKSGLGEQDVDAGEQGPIEAVDVNKAL